MVTTSLFFIQGNVKQINLSPTSEYSCLIYVICVSLRVAVFNTYCVEFLICISSSCVPCGPSFSELFLFCLSSSCVPYIATFSGLFLFCLASSFVASFSGLFLFCLSSSCVPYVASFSGLFLFCLSSSMLQVSQDCFCFVCLRLVYPVLPVSLDCPFLIAPSVFSNVSLNT